MSRTVLNTKINKAWEAVVVVYLLSFSFVGLLILYFSLCWKIVERGKSDTPNIQIHPRLLSCLDAGTAIQSGGVKLDIWLNSNVHLNWTYHLHSLPLACLFYLWIFFVMFQLVPTFDALSYYKIHHMFDIGNYDNGNMARFLKNTTHVNLYVDLMVANIRLLAPLTRRQ